MLGFCRKGIEMRAITIALFGLFAATSLAFAGEDEGKIKKIDADNMIIQLEDGKSYKLPGEFDMTAISPGVTVLLTYDKVGDVNLITDLIVED
jgi:hypothetical protein